MRQQGNLRSPQRLPHDLYSFLTTLCYRPHTNFHRNRNPKHAPPHLPLPSTNHESQITNHKSRSTKTLCPQKPSTQFTTSFLPTCPTNPLSDHPCFPCLLIRLSNPAPCIFPLMQYHISHQFLTHPSCQTGSIISSSWHFAFM